MSTGRGFNAIEEQLTYSVIGSFKDVHRELGFGFREYVYSLALERALIAKGHCVEREVAVNVYFRGEFLTRERVDMLVDRKLIVENKAGEKLPPDATLQLFGYLCATIFEIGLVLHYGREARPYRVIYENRFKAHFVRSAAAEREMADAESTELPPPPQPR
jgi:GxxExxY protein